MVIVEFKTGYLLFLDILGFRPESWEMEEWIVCFVVSCLCFTIRNLIPSVVCYEWKFPWTAIANSE